MLSDMVPFFFTGWTGETILPSDLFQVGQAIFLTGKPFNRFILDRSLEDIRKDH